MTNPHAFIDVDVPNDAGGTDLWKVELNSPNNLKRQGWKSAQMLPGDKVIVVINPLRDGSKGGLFVAVTLPGWQGHGAIRPARAAARSTSRRSRRLPAHRPRTSPSRRSRRAP